MKDSDYREETITSAKRDGDGWIITMGDWSLRLKSSPIDPTPGMTARLYPGAFGAMIRGVYLDGHKVFYRTAAEQTEYIEVRQYGASIEEWLERWDRGQSVWTVEMGGLGPGYEQAIQVTVAEVIRHLVTSKADAGTWEQDGEWTAARESIHAALRGSPAVEALGLSGSQEDAAVYLGAKLYREGPHRLLSEAPRDRLIQASRVFPTA